MRAPGRLKVEQTLSGLRIQVPGEQRVSRALYIGLFTLMAIGGMAGGLKGGGSTGEALIGMLLFLPLMGLIAVLLWRLLSWLLQHIQSGSVAALSLLFLLLFAGFTSVSIPNTDVAVGLVVSGVVALLYCGLIRLWVGPILTVTIGLSTLTIEQGRKQWALPLEDVHDLQRSTKRFRLVHINGQPFSGLGELKQAEWDWLERAITDGAERRRHVLRAEGHDLTRRADPPTGLAALTSQTPSR